MCFGMSSFAHLCVCLFLYVCMRTHMQSHRSSQSILSEWVIMLIANTDESLCMSDFEFDCLHVCVRECVCELISQQVVRN